MTKEQKRARKALNDKRVVILNTLKGEDEEPYHRRGKLLANTPLETPPLDELAKIFRAWKLI